MKWYVVVAMVVTSVALSISGTLLVLDRVPSLSTAGERGQRGEPGPRGPAGSTGKRGPRGKDAVAIATPTPRADPSYSGEVSYTPVTAADKTIDRWCDRLYNASADDQLAADLYKECPGAVTP